MFSGVSAFNCNFVCNTTQKLSECCKGHVKCNPMWDEFNNTFVCDALYVFDSVCCGDDSKFDQCDFKDIGVVCELSNGVEKCCNNKTLSRELKDNNPICNYLDSLKVVLKNSVCDIVDVIDKKCCSPHT